MCFVEQHLPLQTEKVQFVGTDFSFLFLPRHDFDLCGLWDARSEYSWYTVMQIIQNGLFGAFIHSIGKCRMR